MTARDNYRGAIRKAVTPKAGGGFDMIVSPHIFLLFKV
jgi:hypothetical protein